MSRRRRLGRILLAAGLLTWPVGALLAAHFGVEVTILARVRTPEERAAWRERGWDARDGVAELYGWVEAPPGLRVIVFDAGRLLVPDEDPALTLLPLDRRAGEDVLTARAWHGRAILAAAALALLGLCLLLVPRRAA